VNRIESSSGPRSIEDEDFRENERDGGLRMEHTL
jgi:hypothetical protein